MNSNSRIFLVSLGGIGGNWDAMAAGTSGDAASPPSPRMFGSPAVDSSGNVGSVVAVPEEYRGGISQA